MREKHKRRGKRSSLASRLPSIAWKTPKNNACYTGYHSWAKIKGGIYEKKNREVAQKQEGKGFSVKNKTYFERNEETVCG